MRVEDGLIGLQRRFLSALREPIFGDSRVRSELPARTGAPSSAFVATANALITPSPTLQAVERLELYHRQYWYRLLDSMAEDFPALRALLGDEPFWRLMEAFLESNPPTSFTLRHLGSGLADFLRANPDVVTHASLAEDLARLEYALCEAFEAADHPTVEPAQLASVRLALQPHVRLLALRGPVDAFWRKIETSNDAGVDARKRPSEGPAIRTRARRFVVVYRQSLGLHVERLPRLAFVILSAIVKTGSLDEAMAAATATPGLLRERDAGRVRSWFATWVERGWFRRADAPALATPTERNVL